MAFGGGALALRVCWLAALAHPHTDGTPREQEPGDGDRVEGALTRANRGRTGGGREWLGWARAS